MEDSVYCRFVTNQEIAKSYHSKLELLEYVGELELFIG